MEPAAAAEATTASERSGTPTRSGSSSSPSSSHASARSGTELAEEKVLVVGLVYDLPCGKRRRVAALPYSSAAMKYGRSTFLLSFSRPSAAAANQGGGCKLKVSARRALSFPSSLSAPPPHLLPQLLLQAMTTGRHGRGTFLPLFSSTSPSDHPDPECRVLDLREN